MIAVKCLCPHCPHVNGFSITPYMQIIITHSPLLSLLLLFFYLFYFL